MERNGRLATLVPTAPCFALTVREPVPGRWYVLSRFAYLRREQEEMLLESPLAHARVVLHDWRAAALVHAFARPERKEDLPERVPALSAQEAGELMGLLIEARMLCELTDRAASPEDESSPLACWEFHDLLFHARSRSGRHGCPVGGTYRFAGRSAPPPVLKRVVAGELIDLHRPDLGRIEREDPPFAWVQERRRSIREYAETPISAREAGEFLYRVGRMADYWEDTVWTPEGPVRMSFAPRPYPGGGALYELELYLAVNACDGLAPGLYYYDPERHRLGRLSGRTASVERLLLEAAQAARMPADRVQILFIVASRFERIAWKYTSIAYALTLKHVGVLFQTMYLAATAMGLAPCAIGDGNADLFADASGTDYYSETSVGEFLLGRRHGFKP